MFLVDRVLARVLFDSGATHSFVSVTFATQLIHQVRPLPCPLEVEVADDRTVIVRDVHRGFEIEFGGVAFPIDLIPIAMRELSVIVGMDWMERFRAKISCFEKCVEVRTPGGEELTIQGDAWRRNPTFCSMAKAMRYLRREGGYLAYVVTPSDEAEVVNDPSGVRIVSEFGDVFPNELPGDRKSVV